MRKFLKLLAVLVVLVLVAAACGDNSDEESNADPGSADGDDAADGDSASDGDGDDPSAESDGPGEVTTVRMVLWPGPEGDAMQQVVDAYNDGLGQNQGVQIEMILLSRDDTFARELTEIAAESSAVDLYFHCVIQRGAIREWFGANFGSWDRRVGVLPCCVRVVAGWWRAVRPPS